MPFLRVLLIYIHPSKSHKLAKKVSDHIDVRFPHPFCGKFDAVSLCTNWNTPWYLKMQEHSWEVSTLRPNSSFRLFHSNSPINKHSIRHTVLQNSYARDGVSMLQMRFQASACIASGVVFWYSTFLSTDGSIRDERSQSCSVTENNSDDEKLACNKMKQQYWGKAQGERKYCHLLPSNSHFIAERSKWVLSLTLASLGTMSIVSFHIVSKFRNYLDHGVRTQAALGHTWPPCLPEKGRSQDEKANGKRVGLDAWPRSWKINPTFAGKDSKFIKIQTYVQYGFADFFALMHTSDDTCVYLQHYAHGSYHVASSIYISLLYHVDWFVRGMGLHPHWGPLTRSFLQYLCTPKWVV